MKNSPSNIHQREIRVKSWKALWEEYFWHGSGGRFISRNIESSSVLYKIFPPIGILAEFSRSLIAYILVRRKVVFLLPLHWIFKRIAWSLGFAIGYTMNYLHIKNQ